MLVLAGKRKQGTSRGAAAVAPQPVGMAHGIVDDGNNELGTGVALHVDQFVNGICLQGREVRGYRVELARRVHADGKNEDEVYKDSIKVELDQIDDKLKLWVISYFGGAHNIAFAGSREDIKVPLYQASDINRIYRQHFTQGLSTFPSFLYPPGHAATLLLEVVDRLLDRAGERRKLIQLENEPTE